MADWSALAAAGLWLALPVTGFWCCIDRLPRTTRRRGSPLAWWGLATAVGLAVWSLPLLIAAELGVYRPRGVGLVGWVMVLAFALRHRRRPRPQTALESAPWDRWDSALALGLLLAAGLFFGFPSEGVLGGVDQGVYSNVGSFLEREGHLDVPLPSHGLADPAPAYALVPGFRMNPAEPGKAAHLTPHFAHLFPVWLAQAKAALGLDGLLRLNGFLALVALLCFHATALVVVSRPVALVATLFLAFNPAQLWIARITLSEPLAQVFVWAGLALLLRLPTSDEPGPARWAGFLFGLTALARVDGFVLLPLLLLAQGATRVFGHSPRNPWPALYQTAIPTFAAAAASYALGSPFYLEGMMPYLAPVGVVTLAALYPVLALTPGARDLVRRWTRPRALRIAAVVVLGLLFVWAYWVRPIPKPTEAASQQWHEAQTATPGQSLTSSASEGPDWGRNSLSNLGRYLSPLVLLLALLAVGSALWRTLEQRVRDRLLVFFVVWGGFTVAYLDDPAVDPLHFWAVRRFVPLVLPGFVLAAALGWRFGARRLPPRGRALATIALVALLGAHTAWVSSPLAFFARDSGVVEQLRGVAEQLPEDDVVLVPTFRRGWAQWLTPLHFVFERRLHPFDPNSPRRMEKVAAWIERQRAAGKPVFLMTEQGAMPATCCPGKELVGRFPLHRSVLEPTFWPVPRTIQRSEKVLEIYRLPAHPRAGQGPTTDRDPEPEGSGD